MVPWRDFYEKKEGHFKAFVSKNIWFLRLFFVF